MAAGRLQFLHGGEHNSNTFVLCIGMIEYICAWLLGSPILLMESIYTHKHNNNNNNNNNRVDG